MNIWDSVQRGLEKASHEAARIARVQRLRSTSDRLFRQITLQEGTLLTKARELYTSGLLTQSELIPICQEMASLHQQLNDAQNELKQLQSQAPQSGATPSYPPSGQAGPHAASSDIAPTIYAPPPPSYILDSTVPIATPPPPPGAEGLTVSSQETILTPSESRPTTKQRCSHCQAEAIPDNAYCHNCGMPLQQTEIFHQPTVRSGTQEALSVPEQETVRASDEQ